ncbi:hypothetical protein [[Clostridium] aminophilum]|uniref:hypothetical protein n=1 Tax=[Clostridium] aminophilum TaxID=1526 RepID=UPI0033188B3E
MGEPKSACGLCSLLCTGYAAENNEKEYSRWKAVRSRVLTEAGTGNPGKNISK